MSEVIDRPPVLDKQTEEVATKPPPKYQVQAWCGGFVCVAKFATTLKDVFLVPTGVGCSLGETLRSTKRVDVAVGLTRDVAESKALQAGAKMKDLVGDCSCGNQVKFMAIPEA